MRTLIITMLVFTLTFTATAQEETPDKAERVEAYKIAFITEKLDLTPKEASAFWPVYNEYGNKVKTLRDKQRERDKQFKQNHNPTDAESNKFIADFLAFKQQETDLMQRYIPEFKKVLPVAKAARLVTLEQEFKMQLLHKLKDKRSPKG
jgi:hypothetical protein